MAEHWPLSGIRQGAERDFPLLSRGENAQQSSDSKNSGINPEAVAIPVCKSLCPCQDPAGNRTTRRPPEHSKETKTAVVWSCLPFISSGQNHLARHSERGKKTRQTEEQVGTQHQGKVPEGRGEQGKMEKSGCEIICGALTTLAVKGSIMMMMTSYSTEHIFLIQEVIFSLRIHTSPD